MFMFYGASIYIRKEYPMREGCSKFLGFDHVWQTWNLINYRHKNVVAFWAMHMVSSAMVCLWSRHINLNNMSHWLVVQTIMHWNWSCSVFLIYDYETFEVEFDSRFYVMYFVNMIVHWCYSQKKRKKELWWKDEMFCKAHVFLLSKT